MEKSVPYSKLSFVTFIDSVLSRATILCGWSRAHTVCRRAVTSSGRAPGHMCRTQLTVPEWLPDTPRMSWNGYQTHHECPGMVTRRTTNVPEWLPDTPRTSRYRYQIHPECPGIVTRYTPKVPVSLSDMYTPNVSASLPDTSPEYPGIALWRRGLGC